NATEMVNFYQDSDIICFPSKLETWGLPLSEAKTYKKWIFAADLPYAHEVLYNYSKTRYFPFDDEKILVRYILEYTSKNMHEDIKNSRVNFNNDALTGFEQFIEYILKGN
ncbi:TPA: glycosyltransferase, partial [Escherichia coli]|nr:glycosyltransferase [Escherichia coli]HCP3181748.1 glycosyltransferase [Escherichia coli]HDS2670260.1 glycosyltransferase [Escherichia coli]